MRSSNVVREKPSETSSALDLHRTIPPVDILVAVIAERHRLTVLHSDHDFDRLRRYTDLELTAEWLAPAGSL